MVNPNKKIRRPDGLGKVYRYKTDEEDKILTLPIEKLIKDNYPYIQRAINKENFYIASNDSCFFFKEVLYDDEVVGFATYRANAFNKDSLVMQYIYLLPEYRNKGLLIEELDEASILFESSILIEYPSRAIVETLVKHKMARVFNDRFVVSKVAFIVPMISIEDATSGVTREEFDMTSSRGYTKLSLIYDLELCAVVGVASDDIENMYNEDEISEDDTNLNNYNIMSLPLKVDDKEFDCINKRANNPKISDGTYFKEVKEIIDNENDVIQNWLTML